MNPSPNAPQGAPQRPPSPPSAPTPPNGAPTGNNGVPPSGTTPIPPNGAPNRPSATPISPNITAPPSTTPTPAPNGAPSPTNNGAGPPRGVPFDLSSLNNDANPTLAPKWNRAWALLALALVAFMFFFWAYGLGVRAQRPMPLGPIKSQSSVPATVRVYVEGAVARPGVYSLSTDARVSDAIALAGGLSSDGDPAAINLAAFVQDGSKISVPHLAPTPSVQVQSPPPLTQPQLQPAPTSPQNSLSTVPQTLPPSPSSSSTTTKAANAAFFRAHPLDLNTATKEELQQLPNVGPVMAERILTYRTINGRFKSVADLDNIQGIGEKRLEALKDMVVVR